MTPRKSNMTEAECEAAVRNFWEGCFAHIAAIEEDRPCIDCPHKDGTRASYHWWCGYGHANAYPGAAEHRQKYQGLAAE